ncbi:MAG: YlqD family protein [Gloeomargarita sp. SKYG116]|nr:YlqD family protein [Gloeomargarita sp. SKYG116]MCS7226229.1 YlqD family protein [Gloeomargarita sp. SKYB31]MDW8401826.1 YlqD family protein [Gloeomargarita sp. SKYGB_i_bin116]
MANGQELILKRAVNIKVIVTPRWKEETLQILQSQINQIDARTQQIDMQVQRAITELKKQPASPQLTEQINSIQFQANDEKSKLLDQKNQILTQLTQVQTLEMEQEVLQGQLDGYFTVKVGENLIEKMQVEVVIRDGVVQEIRGII